MDYPEVEERIKTCRALMLIQHSFFASLMLSMPMIITTDVPTAATDMRSMWINPEFVSTISNKVLLFVIAHEIMHVALMHGTRLQGRDPKLWNIAADYSINLSLKDAKFEVWEHALCNERFRGDDKHPMSTDHIYNLIKQEQANKPKPKPGKGQPGQPGQGQPGQGEPGQGEPGPGEPGGGHESPMLGDLKDPGTSNDPAAEGKLVREIQQKVAQAAAVARMTGNMSGTLERFVEEVLTPKVPWYDVLRHLMTEAAADDEDWCTRDRRFQGIYLPSDYSERMGELVAIGDSSGSCYDDMPAYFTEFLAIAEELKPERIRLIWCDSTVTHEQVFEDGDEIKLGPKGFGGTDMRVALKHVEEFNPRIVILFTDGYTPWPKEDPPYPLIVCCTTDQKSPVGDVIRL